MNFELVVRDNYINIYNYALKLSCHPEDAQDLTQQTFLIAYEKMDQLRNEEALRVWLRRICYRNFLMLIRERGIKEESLDEMKEIEGDSLAFESMSPLPEEEVLVDEDIKLLQNGCFMAMVRRLSLNQRIAFSLVDMFGMDINSAAELLEISTNALKGLLFRARMNLDSFFDRHCNLLNENNTCSCRAWITFRENHEKNKTEMKKEISYLDYKEKGYRFDENTRAKVKYLYSNMPEQRPADGWFDEIIKVFQEK